jgi:HAD superfamily hydrolase (TIGR01509 family)
MSRQPIRGLIFDFDGLILDTEIPAFEAWREVYEEHGATLALDTWARVLGGSGLEVDHIAELERVAGRTLNGDAIRRRRLERKLALIEPQDVLPGVRGYIANGKQRGLKLAVVSSSPHRWVEGYLAKFGLIDTFDAIVCAEDAPRSKPHPDLYQRALEQLHILPEEAIAFEDSPNGITAAQKAGIFCVTVPNDISSRFPIDHADYRLDSLADMSLEDLLARVEHGQCSRITGQQAP